ncbi:MAG: phosphomethylpyrimidine synthase ThiC, partial [Duncaniella sp.]|nr:phosphomethylpyrimidine synthase ThiC [Duncaniella sp.]
FNLSLDPARARQYYVESHEHTDDRFCTMCGPNFCAMRISSQLIDDCAKK